MSYYYGVSGIYAILNAANGKMYVGMTKNIGQRFATHRRNLKRGKHENRHLQSAWSFYGEGNFQFIVLEKCDPHVLSDREQYYIKLFGTMDRENGYNSTNGGECPDEITEEMRKNMSDAHKGKNTGPDHPMYGKKRSEESRKKQSESRKGKYTGEQSNLYGISTSIEGRKRISEARKGKPLSEEHRQKIKEAQNRPEIKKKMSENRKGKPNGRLGIKMNEQQREKISQDQMFTKRNSTSKYIGVTYVPASQGKNKWRARTTIDKKEYCIGHFFTEAEAAMAFNEFAIEQWGWKAKLNDIPQSEIEALWDDDILISENYGGCEEENLLGGLSS